MSNRIDGCPPLLPPCAEPPSEAISETPGRVGHAAPDPAAPDAALPLQPALSPAEPPPERLIGSLPERTRERLVVLSAMVGRASSGDDPAGPLREVGQRGPAALGLLEAARRFPAAYLELLGRPPDPEGVAAVRDRAADAIEGALGEHLRSTALVRLDALEARLAQLVGELEGEGPRPTLERLFDHLASLDWEARSTLLRGLDLQLGSAWLSGDVAPHLFEASHPHRLEDPEAARATLLAEGEVTFLGHELGLADLRERLGQRLGALEAARTYVEDCEHPLLIFRPLTRALADAMPSVERVHELARLRHGGQPIEAPRDGWRGELASALLGRDTALAETLLLAGLVDAEQVDLAAHRAGFEVTLALASLLAPSPQSGLASGLKRAGARPVGDLVEGLTSPVAREVGLRAGIPLAEWLVKKGISGRLGGAGDLPEDLLRESLQGDGAFDAPLRPGGLPPRFE